MTGIPYGRAGMMLGLRNDHDVDKEHADLCRLCSPLPARSEYWQRGCPTTGLSVAPVWRPRAVSEGAIDPLVRARTAVAQAHQRVGGQLAVQGRAPAVRWQAEDTAGQDGCERAVGAA